MADESPRCSTPGCNKAATLQCPKCLTLKIKPHHFCSQECFKSYYKSHNEVHKAATFVPPPFKYTGTLRPSYVSPMRSVPRHIPRPDYADHISGVSDLERTSRQSIIEVHDVKTIEKMRRTCRAGREVLDLAARAVRPGVTTDEIDRIVHEACIERQCYPSPLNYFNFPKSVCTSVNEVICHGIPDFRELCDGDIVNIDVSVYKEGVHGDLNETYYVGRVDADGRRVVETAKLCLDKALELVKPGTLYREVGTAIEKAAKSNQCSVVRTYCGHGVSDMFHTAPTIPHYAKNKAPGQMKAGNIFTIEPMINLGTWHDEKWPDDWTAVTTDGLRSAQFEHTILVTETGYELLTGRLDDSPFSAP